MDTFDLLQRVDDVRTFPNIEMPKPAVKKPTTGKRRSALAKLSGNSSGDNLKFVMQNDKLALPGLLKSRRSTINSARNYSRDEEKQTFVGFTSSSLKLDVAPTPPLPEGVAPALNLHHIHPGDRSPTAQKVAQVDLSSSVPLTQRSTGSNLKGKKEKDATLEELRNYITLMDKFSLHNFMIYDGRALKDTPEFQSFKRTHQEKWGAISSIIRQLERFLFSFEVKLAIINGPALFELSKMDPTNLTKEEIYSVIANKDQIANVVDFGAESRKKNFLKAIVVIQATCRRFLAKVHVNRLSQLIRCVIIIQSFTRLYLSHSRARIQQRTDMSKSDERWNSNVARLEQWWQRAVHAPLGDPARCRTIIYIPSITVSEYLRMDMESFHAMQNTHISNIAALADPDVTLIYISPFKVSNYDTAYQEKFLSLFGISILPRRLVFLTPTLIDHLPPHLSLAQVLWCSSGTLNRLRVQIARSNFTMIVPGTIGWVEKRLSNYLNVPLLSSDPFVAETVSSRSFSKRMFMGSALNIPIGSHDIMAPEDMLIAFSRLIASNLGVARWIVRLNDDWNNESCMYLDVDRLPVVRNLRHEQIQVAGGNGPDNNPAAWFARHIQLPVRKRLLHSLKENGPKVFKVCRPDIYPNLEYYMRWMRQYGCVIEAEPLEKIGYVQTLCFIDPFGAVQSMNSVELLIDVNYQTQGHIYPQTVAPPLALTSAVREVAAFMFEKYHVIGFVTMTFVSWWDAFEEKPRLWATGIRFGLSPVFGALAKASVASSLKMDMPLHYMPDIPDGKFIVYIPMARHEPLKQTQDDVFLKLCRMRGIAFDMKNRVGSLFLLVDKIVSGAVSLLCIAGTRKKSLELTVHTLSFIVENYGKETEDTPRKCDNLTNILKNLKRILKLCE